MPSEPDALSRLGFIAIDAKINPNILLFTPAASTSPSSTDPKLIILATWLGGATSSRIAVYCRAYQSLYQSSPILLIRAVLTDITTKTSAALQAQLIPARKYLLSTFPPPNENTTRPSGKALLHIFSHGGCNTVLQLSRLLRNRPDGSSSAFPIPLLGVILDSCPGSASFDKAYRAAAYSLPDGKPVNLLGRACLYPLIGSISLLQKCGILSSVEDLRRELNDLSTFGDIPRLYLHSKGDKVVAAEDVAAHADEMAANGVSVSRHVWEFAEHCALPVEDSEKYLNAVQEFVTNQAAGKVAAKL